MLQFMDFLQFHVAVAFMLIPLLVDGVYLQLLDIVNIQEEVEVLYSGVEVQLVMQEILEEWEWFAFHTVDIFK